MAKNTKIEWAHHTFNPWIGCTKVSREATGGGGCDGCYAEVSIPARILRSQGHETWGPGAPRRRTSEANWRQPLKWNAEAARLGVRYRVFCASLADVFDNAVLPSWRADLFELIEETPHLDWLLLTKRIGNVSAMMIDVARELFWMENLDKVRVLPNVWIGATIVNQAEADRDIPKLLAVPAAKRFLSMEPLLGPVDLRYLQPGDPPTEINALAGTHGVLRPHRGTCDRIDWVIVGGESGHGARPMHPDWARSLRDQCQAAGVPFMFKQWGNWHPPREGIEIIASSYDHQFEDDTWMEHVGKKQDAGRLLDGRTWDEVPA